MHLLHLTASSFYGGPERQLAGLAQALRPHARTTIASFAEGGRCREFLGHPDLGGATAIELRHDTPHFRAAVSEVAELARAADFVLCHGYKAALLGRPAARRAGTPVLAVSRGWTWENWKVRAYTALDRVHLRAFDHVVAVSDGQARKCRRAGVPPNRLSVIRNSARLSAFDGPADPAARQTLLGLFPAAPEFVLVAAGRLSPEKGFADLIRAMRPVAERFASAGLVIFGDGEERPALEALAAKLGLAGRVVMPGFRRDLDALWPAADLAVLSSESEGLPNVLLEASAAGVPVVATRVGGVPEVVADGLTGWLVRPRDPAALGGALVAALSDPAGMRARGAAGRLKMEREFTFAAQAGAYRQLLAGLPGRPAVRAAG